MARHLVELQTSAARQLDAADYSLARLRLDLTTVAPNLLDGLPDWAADQLVPAEEVVSAHQSQLAVVHRDLAA